MSQSQETRTLADDLRAARALIDTAPTRRHAMTTEAEIEAALDAFLGVLSIPYVPDAPHPREAIRAALSAAARVRSEEPVAFPPVADVSVVPFDDNNTYVKLVVEPKHEARREYRISVGAADVLFHELAAMAGHDDTSPVPSRE